jgi:GNAT superfamily N-acetyltransferase
MPKGYEIREPREEERADLFKVFYACFPAHVEVFKKLEHNDRPISDYFYGYEPRVMIMDGRIMANVSLVRYTIYLNGKEVPIGGIGSVVTHPDYQRKGYAKILMEERLRNMLEEGIYISVLLTELPWAYETLGWKVVPQDYRVVELADQKDTKIDSNISVVEDPKKARSIMDLYDATAPSLNGAIKRVPSYWEEYYFAGVTGFDGSGDRFLFYRDGSKLLGYARLHDEESQVLVSEVIVKDWNPEILEKLVRSAMKVVWDKGVRTMVFGLQDNHPLRKKLVEMGLNPVWETPEGRREFGMVNVLDRVYELGKYVKRLHWCYNDKF